jgi:hypothetical protein
MATDLELIKELERDIWDRIAKLPSKRLLQASNIGYTTDENGNVIGLNLFEKRKTAFYYPFTLPKLKNLRILRLYGYHQIRNLLS